jgi:hypothetical protein
MNDRAPIVGLLFIAAGVLLLLDVLDVIDVLRWNVIVPLILIALGASMLVAGWSATRSSSGPVLDEVTVFSDRDLTGPELFAGGSVTAVFADVELDLRRSTLDGSPVSLVVTIVFGEVKVLVPPSWRVRTTGSALLADVEVHRDEPTGDGPAPELVVRTSGLLGDITVR